MPLCVTLPTPQGINPGPYPWYQLVPHLGCLPQLSLTEAPRRQAGEKVLSQSQHRSQKSRHILAWNTREMLPACACHLKVFPITGLGLQELNWRASQNILSQIYRTGMPGKFHHLAPASSLHLPPQSVHHHWSGATAAKLEGLPKHSVPIIISTEHDSETRKG